MTGLQGCLGRILGQAAGCGLGQLGVGCVAVASEPLLRLVHPSLPHFEISSV